MSMSALSLPAACINKTPFFSAYFTASSTTFLSQLNLFPKLIFKILAPLSTAYLIAFATSLSLSSPAGTHLTAIIFTSAAIPSIPIPLFLEAAIIPAT